MRVLIIGCGYVGLPLGVQLLRQGHAVFGLRRSAEGAACLQRAGLQPLVADITRRDDLAGLPLPLRLDRQHHFFRQGRSAGLSAGLFRRHPQSAPVAGRIAAQKYVHTGSTSVYGQTDASEVRETSPAEPATPTGRILLAAEKLLLDSFREQQFPAVLLRVAGNLWSRARPPSSFNT